MKKEDNKQIQSLKNILSQKKVGTVKPLNSAQLGSPEIVRYCEVLRYFASNAFQHKTSNMIRIENV